MNCILSIIIVNWNVADLLINTIQSIYANSPTNDFEIIVVDNASSDDSIIKLNQYFPMVKVITNAKNVGFSRANNQGIEIAKGKYIFLLNPDTIVMDDAINKLLNILENNPDFGMVGPQLLSKAGQDPLQVSARLTRTFLSGVFLDLLYVQRFPFFGQKLVKLLRYPYDLNKMDYVEVISGAAMMFRASIIEKIGALNEKFFMAGEDTEFCDRFRKNGFRIYYYPAARIIHLDQSCTPQNPVDIFINRFMSVATYYDLKYGRWIHQYFRFISYLILIPKLLLKSLFYLITGDIDKNKVILAMLKKLLRWRFVGDAKYLN